MRPVASRLWLVAALATGAPGAAWALGGGAPVPVDRTTTQGPVTVRVQADKSGMTTAELLHVTVTVSTPDGITASLPELGAKFGGFTVDARADAPAKLEDGRLARETRLTLEPFLAGEYEIPGIDVPYSRVGGGDAGTVSTEPLKIAVASVLPADAKLDFGPVRGVVSPAPARSSWLIVTGVCAAAGALALSGVAVTRRRRGRVAPEAAATHLDALRAAAEQSEVSAREVCDRAAPLVRRAFAARVAGAEAMTTEQLLAAAPAARITAHELDELREFLHTCDAVRYAGEPADAGTLLRLLRSMVSLAADLERPAPKGAAA